jgi:toxin ParE1/3/4
MTPEITLRPRARIDLLEQFAWFGEESSVELAERYLAAVEETCSLLATQPLMGAVYETSVAELREMRRFRVKGFDNYLIFYQKTDIGIEVVRVLHGARDLDSLFANEESQP